MGGENSFDNGASKFSSTLKEVNNAVEKKRVIEKDGVMSIDLSGRIKSDADLEKYSELTRNLKEELEGKIGTRLETMPIVVISGGDNPLSLGTCANLGDTWMDVDGNIKDETIIVISPEGLEAVVDGETDYAMALEGKLRHELTHAIVNKYCQERGLDIHERDNRFFSELMAVTSENKVLGGSFKDVFDFYIVEDQGIERISEEFPRELWYDQVYIQFPIFWDKLSKDMNNPDLVLDLFKKWVQEKGGKDFLNIKGDKVDDEALSVMKAAGIVLDKVVKSSEFREMVDDGEKDLDIKSKQVIGKLFATIYKLNIEGEKNGRGLLGASATFKDAEKPLTEEIINFISKNIGLGSESLDKKWSDWRRGLSL